MAKNNSFEARDKKIKRKSAISKMAELREDLASEIKETETIKEDIVKTPLAPVPVTQEVENDFFNLSLKNKGFEGKVTSIRVYSDIADTLKQYASLKNYPLMEFTNKIIEEGLKNLNNFGKEEISEIKLKSCQTKAVMYNLTDLMDAKIGKFITEMQKEGIKLSRNIILNVILNETLKRFYFGDK